MGLAEEIHPDWRVPLLGVQRRAGSIGRGRASGKDRIGLGAHGDGPAGSSGPQSVLTQEQIEQSANEREYKNQHQPSQGHTDRQAAHNDPDRQACTDQKIGDKQRDCNPAGLFHGMYQKLAVSLLR